jgi:autotransporter translocation and assembly factor TamB
MRRQNPIGIPFLFILLLFVILLFGCASIPVGKYEALNDSSKQLSAKTSETYTRIEKLQRYFAVITAENANINENSFKPEVDGNSIDMTPELRFREDAMEVMVKYTNLLASISSKDYQADVDKSSQDLAASLKNLASSSGATQHAAQVSGIAGTLINVVSKQVIEQKRATALRNTMDMAQINIEKLSNLIVGSNQKIKGLVKIMQGRIIAHANAARPPYATAARITFDSTIADLLAETNEINASLDLMSVAIGKIPEAHKEIRIALDNKPTTLDALQGLVQEAQRANKFYRNLSH